MRLSAWLEEHHPGRGGRAWLVRESGCSYETVGRALRDEPIDSKRAAERLSEATGGVVTVISIMHPEQSRKSA